MNRNANSRFAVNPTNIDISRSTFNRPSSCKTSFNVGQLIPFYCDEVLPGDTFQIRTNLVARMQPMVSAPLDNLYLDTYYFFIPNRLTWQHWRELNGENTQSAWAQPVEYAVPQVTAPSGGWNVGSLADYLGIPTGVENISVSALPFRAVALVVDQWFRDQNLQQPLNVPLDDSTQAGSNGDDYITDLVNGGKPFIANKFFDLFTSALPAPQKGPDVNIELADLNLSGTAPVLTNATTFTPNKVPMSFNLYNDSSNAVSTTNKLDMFTYYGVQNIGANGFSNSIKPNIDVDADNDTINSTIYGIPNNLYAQYDLVASGATSVTINQLRMAFQIQKLYEKDARGGTRYVEILKSHFGVTSPDSRLQRTEYLGGHRVPININQVVQMSASDSTSPQGNVTGQSLTADSHGDFIKSFTEHGYIIGLCVARYDHTYQQGIPKHFMRKTRFDFYWPVLANIGEQAILNESIYAQGTDEDKEVFGYNEAWAEYRYKPDIVTGEMRSSAQNSLDVWHFADDYASLPTLSASWIQEDKTNVDRVLAVQSSVSNQLFADFYIENRTTRPMPMYSIPGLIDHH